MYEARDFLRRLDCDTTIACCAAGYVVRITLRR
jgi:hypothetical protein